MPVTPLHIGIPGFPALVKPDRVDITSAILGSTLVDIDFFRCVLTGYPLHGDLHTYLGATVLACFISVAVWIGDPLNARIKASFRWETGTNLKAISAGAFLGAYSHVFLDSFLYSDIRPLHPFSDGNVLYSEMGGDVTTGVVYGVTALTTTVLLVHWVKRFQEEEGGKGTLKDGKEEEEGGNEPAKEKQECEGGNEPAKEKQGGEGVKGAVKGGRGMVGEKEL